MYKILSSSRLSFAVCLLTGLLTIPTAWAHWNYSSTMSKTTTQHIRQYTCAPTWVWPGDGLTYNLVSFDARVRDKAPVATPYVRVQVLRVAGTVYGVQQTDPNSNTSTGDGDAAGVGSPFSTVAAAGNGGNEIFKIRISKSSTAAAENYELEYHCLYSNPNNGIDPNHPTPGALTSSSTWP